MCSFTLKTYTVSDGYRCHYRDYPAAGTPRGRVVFVHGIQSHAGWYEHSCRRLSEAGFAVSFLDRRGSGQNTEARGDTPSFRRLLDDIAEFLQPLRQQEPALPLVLGGISWGGKPVAALQRRHPGLCDGLALLCPGFRPQVSPSRKERLGILLSRLMTPRRLFTVPLSDPRLFTATPRWQQFIRDDPLSIRQATARFFVESVRLDLYLRFAVSRIRRRSCCCSPNTIASSTMAAPVLSLSVSPAPTRKSMSTPARITPSNSRPIPNRFCAICCIGWSGERGRVSAPRRTTPGADATPLDGIAAGR